jgi:hypothetical protein
MNGTPAVVEHEPAPLSASPVLAADGLPSILPYAVLAVRSACKRLEATMIASIYARKSSDQTGVSDEQRSVTRQVEHGKAYAARKG